MWFGAAAGDYGTISEVDDDTYLDVLGYTDANLPPVQAREGPADQVQVQQNSRLFLMD